MPRQPLSGQAHKGKGSGRRKAAADSPEPGGDDDDLDAALGPVLDSVVKVWCVHSTPNFSLPWQRRRQERSSGSGFCISLSPTRVIMTNAHCIEWHAQVRVQRRGDDTKYLARVLAVGWECDLALLTVEDDEFWTELRVVHLSKKIPHLEERVLCVGFPVGGDTISVTSGVISRVETTMYSQASTELLGIQIDAAINSGNSGGPAFNDNGECVGVAFQSLGSDEAENVGYVIPTVVVSHFLEDLLNNKKYTGFPVLGVEYQTMENPQLREFFGMASGRSASDSQRGVLVTRIAPTAAVAKVLKENDVLMAFNGELIGNDGTVKFRKSERVSFTWLVAQKFYGDKVHLSVQRGGERLELEEVHLLPEEQLVPVHLFNTLHQGPSYLIYAGLVFTLLSVPFLRAEFGEEWDCEAPVEIARAVAERRAAFAGERMVVLSQVLAHPITMGYEMLENLLLHEVNGTPVRNLQHLAELLGEGDQEKKVSMVRLQLQSNMVLILKADAAAAATADVLEKYGIPSATSRDLRGGQEPSAGEET